jgi:hypothetical protein
MKNSIALSIIIVGIAAGLGWHGHRRLSLAEEAHAKLVADATRLGISTDTNDPTADVRFSRGERADRGENGRQTAVELIAFAKEMEERQKKGDTSENDQVMQKRMLEMMDRIAALDATGIKSFIAEVRATTEIKEDMKEGLIGFSIMMLASDHPQAALAIYTEMADVVKNSQMKEQVIASALAEWAKKSPDAALEWVRKNGEAHPDVVTERAKLGIINGTAAQNPQLAFKLITELKLSDPGQAINQMINSTRTPAERTAILENTREYLKTIADPKKREQLQRNSMSNLMGEVAKEGFDSGSKWIVSSKLTPEELQNIGEAGIHSHYLKGDDAGKWIIWMGENVPGEKPANGIRNMMQTWAEQDYKAAGLWLDQAPAGLAKDTSIRAYAETVSRYEPEAAAQWVEILPPGKDKDITIRRIYDNWPKKDAAGKEAAAAYAAKHGIKDK